MPNSQLALALESPESSPCDDELLESSWSESVANDPRHRPQTLDRPSSTVRREWCRYPQEAHLVDLEHGRYRQLVWDEMARLQGFDPEWFDVPTVTVRNRVRAIGDAVPPPLSKAILNTVREHWSWTSPTAIEICAGSGGIAAGAKEMEHLLLVDRWDPSCEILRHRKPWQADRVVCGDVGSIDFAGFAGQVGLLSGGPPCQPWSQSGRRLGIDDPRDLLRSIDKLVAAVQPEVFLFENVPGLASHSSQAYLDDVLHRLREPGVGGIRYGVVSGILNAADFGVAQTRRRIFILGFRDMPSSFAYSIFDAIAESATHRNPLVADDSKPRWRTLRDVLPDHEARGGWRRWNGSAGWVR